MKFDIPDEIVVEAAASKIADNLLRDKKFLIDLVAATDRSGAIEQRRVEIQKIVSDALMLGKARIERFVEDDLQRSVIAELDKVRPATVLRSIRQIEEAAKSIVRNCQKDMGKTLKRAIKEIINDDLEAKLDKLLGDE